MIVDGSGFARLVDATVTEAFVAVHNRAAY